MKFTQALKMAISSVLGNKMRSFLTMLGIIIGILSVIVLIAIGNGSKQDIASSIQGMGTNLVTISLTGKQDRHITDDELNQLKSQPGIKNISPVMTASITAKNGDKNVSTSIEAVNPSYDEIRNEYAQAGRFINQDDIDNRLKVAVVGVDVCDQLFNNRDVLGQTISLAGTNFTIVGILQSTGSTSTGSNDDKIVIPLTTGERVFKNTTIRTFYAEATSADMVDTAVSTLTYFMLKKVNGDTTAYRVFNQTQLLDTRTAASNTMTMMLAGIAAISLLVGGIGIMNIMLVSVTERTREIGIRKAIGAKRRDILTQFLIEALCISGVGGLIGVFLGVMTCQILPKILKQSVVVSTNVVILSFVFSATVGIVFGLYPASKASKLRPIDALRFE